MSKNPFEVQQNLRQQQLKERPQPELTVSAERGADDPLGLSARKRTRQTYTVYLERDLMTHVQRVAKQRGVSASAVIEVCVKKTLEQLEG